MGTLHTNVEFKWNIFHYWDTYSYTRDFIKLQWRGKLHVHHMCSHAHRLQFIQDCDFLFPFFKGEYMTWQCTPVIINYVSVSQLLYQTHPHTLFGMSLPLVFAVIRHFHIAHDASCLTPPPQPPSPPKKRKEKENNLHKNYFQFHLGIHHFHKDHNAPCLPFKFCITIVFDFSWDEGNTREKLKTIVIYYAFIYLCFFFGGGWGGGGNRNKVHYGLCANGEL